MTKHYTICMRPDVEPGDVKIVGPFDTEDLAAAYGENWGRANADNPCWQTVTLPDGFVPSITAPEGQ